jgi:hypothetical protein
MKFTLTCGAPRQSTAWVAAATTSLSLTALLDCYVLAGTQDERDVRSDSVWVQGFSVSMVRGYDEALTAK